MEIFPYDQEVPQQICFPIIPKVRLRIGQPDYSLHQDEFDQ